jgi:hypothetical protein
MRIVTANPKTPAQDTSARSAAKSALPGPTGFGESHDEDAAHPGVARFGYDFGRIPVHAVVEAAKRGTSGHGAPYPFRAQIQSGFGRHDIGHVRAYTGSRAAAAARTIGARAFAYGDRVAFDGTPDLHTAAHEAAHVVQQRAGVQLKDDQGTPGDAFERHADADRIVGRQSAEALLDTMHASRAAAVQRRVVQRKGIPVPTKYGEFNTEDYDKRGKAGSQFGVRIKLTFEPGPNVDATKIGLTQSVSSALDGFTVAMTPAQHKRIVPSGIGAGRQIDRPTESAFANPIYGTKVPGAKDKKLGDSAMLDYAQWGWHYTDSSGPRHRKAILIDNPDLSDRSNDSSQVFETTALAVEGTQSGTYMGSVEWGWRIDADGEFTQLPLKKISDGVPTADFMAAAKQWNKWITAGTIKTTRNPTIVYNSDYERAFEVAKNTEVTVSGGLWHHAGEAYNIVTIKSKGEHKGDSGRIRTDHMRDTGGGRATIDLPIQRASTIKATKAGGVVNLRSGAGTSSAILATLADGVSITVRNETRPWIEVEVDATQTGVALSSDTTKDIADMVRGFVSRDLVQP